MQIHNNVLRHCLKNVYFITGTAYAGKSTAARMLAEQYGMILCGENYHMELADLVVTCEEHFEIEIDEKDIHTLQTIADLIEYIEKQK